MPDQLRADSLGCAGHPNVRTPNIDRLAAGGMRFSQATTVSPICMPARASFANGLYPHNHGMWTNRGEMPANGETFFQILQRAGYCTALIGKSHFYEHHQGMHMREREAYMHARGFDHVHETAGPYAACYTRSYLSDDWQRKGLWERYKQDYQERRDGRGGMVRPSPLSEADFMDSYIGQKSVEFVHAYTQSQPLCLFVGFGGPHPPWDAPGKYASMYDAADMPQPIPIPESSKTLPGWIRSKKDFQVWSDDVVANTGEIRANYYGKVSLIDYWVGEILEACSQRGWSDDLLVVLWSDHGEMLGDHGRFSKATFHEASVRVPLILRWPEQIPANTETQALTEIIDVFPTILEVAGCDPSDRCLGRSLWPIIQDPQAEIRKFQLSEIENGERNTMIRSRDRKYVVDEQAGGFMLYDLENDPHEQNNLIATGEGINLEDEMRTALLERLVETQYSM